MKRILVVDDNRDLSDLLKLFFELRNLEVEIAKSRSEFTVKLEAFEPHLVLMDVMLPHFTGRELCQWAKDQECYRHIPFILMSASKNQLDNYADCKADDVLIKPFDLHDLLTLVVKFLK